MKTSTLSLVILLILIPVAYFAGQKSIPTAPTHNRLTAVLTPKEFSENINALITQAITTEELQDYIGNYEKDSSGNYSLKTSGKSAEKQVPCPDNDPIGLFTPNCAAQTNASSTTENPLGI